MTVYQYTAHITSDNGPGVTLDRINSALRDAGLGAVISYTALAAPAHLNREES